MIALAIGAASLVTTAARPATLTVVAPLAPRLTLSSDPALAFVCRMRRGMRVCAAQVARGAAVALRARTVPPAGAPTVSALSLPVDADAWRGDCAGTGGDVCRLAMTRDRTVRIAVE